MIRSCPCGQFNRRDSKTPDISFKIITSNLKGIGGDGRGRQVHNYFNQPKTLLQKFLVCHDKLGMRVGVSEESLCAAQASLEFLILLLQPLKRWDYKCVLPKCVHKL